LFKEKSMRRSMLAMTGSHAFASSPPSVLLGRSFTVLYKPSSAPATAFGLENVDVEAHPRCVFLCIALVLALHEARV
jgi:hypothetical protein